EESVVLEGCGPLPAPRRRYLCADRVLHAASRRHIHAENRNVENRSDRNGNCPGALIAGPGSMDQSSGCNDGAVEKTRTSTGCPTATATLRVYQFRHDRTSQESPAGAGSRRVANRLTRNKGPQRNIRHASGTS